MGCHAFQPCAVMKRPIPYGGNTVGDGNTFQPCATRKRMRPYAGNAAGDITMSVIVNFVFHVYPFVRGQLSAVQSKDIGALGHL